MRGEYAIPPIRAAISLGSPPLARGIRHPPHSGGDLIRITPACAGNTPAEPQINHAARDHPRLRGEYDGWEEKDSCWGGSPPLARGILYQPYWRGTIHRITPACAGNTQIIQNYLLKIRDHPRLRGEYFSSLSHLAF